MIVEVSGVTKRFGERVAVDGLTLNVPPGVCFGLLGPNGAGKTTTLRMIYGVTVPTSGQVRVFGMDVVRNVRAVRRRLGVTLQQNVLIETLSPRANLTIFGRYHLLDSAALARRVEELIDFMELRSHADVEVAKLSGGYQRRLAVALSLMNRPELLILDEPTTGLDPAVRLGLWSRVRELRSRGATVLLTTHYMDEAQRLCDTVAIMSAGDVIAQGAPEELIERYLARQAVEIEATPAQEYGLLRGLDKSPPRCRLGNRTMVYLDDPAALLDRIRRLPGIGAQVMAVRPTDLEDVFLSLTGTSLEDNP
ncbi:MAG: ABC transporter ATP-binding protein [Deltaproteobacteria bacterium]|nr:ABC transporter ATP-binding protein [Deltaproteobacteria bacterium]